MPGKKLTRKQRAFVYEYLVDFNASKAALRAGYSEKSAAKIGSQLLEKTGVKEAIEEGLQERKKNLEVTAEKVINELSMIAFAKGSDFARVVEKTITKPILNESGEKIGEKEYTYEDVEISPTDSLPEEKKAAIAGIKRTKHGIEISTVDKLKALELLGRHLALFTDKIEHSGALEGVVVLPAVQIAGDTEAADEE